MKYAHKHADVFADPVRAHGNTNIYTKIRYPHEDAHENITGYMNVLMSTLDFGPKEGILLYSHKHLHIVVGYQNPVCA
jgi:hypothetical protein